MSDPPSSNEVDYSHLFNPAIVFPTYDEAFNWANTTARANGFLLYKASYKVAKSSQLRSYYLNCERGVRYEGYLIDLEIAIRKKTGTKKCGCKFKVRVAEVVLDQQYCVCSVADCGKHNHPVGIRNEEGYSRLTRFTDEERNEVHAMYRALIPPMKAREALAKSSEQSDDSLKRKAIHNIRQFYNENQKVRRLDMEGRNPAQHMIHLARKENYIYFYKEDDNGLTHLFICHPESVELLLAYYYVILLDSTYKANKYNMPLLEITGATPLGKNFTIVYVIMRDETSDSYRWALQCLRSLIPTSVSPNSIVTDHEGGLLKALPEVFSDSYNLLCTWHVDKDVRAKVMNIWKDKVQGDIVGNGIWSRVMYAPTEREFKLAVRHLDQTHGTWRKAFYDYYHRQWIPKKEKFAYAWTNNVLHFGERTTNRVESAHRVLKLWLESAHRRLDTIWQRANAMIRGQLIQIKKELEESMVKHPHGFNDIPYQMLRGKLTSKAFFLLSGEVARCNKFGDEIHDRCGCFLTRTHGLPCGCRMFDLVRTSQNIQLEEIHTFWKTLWNPTPLSSVQWVFNNVDNTISSQHHIDGEDVQIREPAVRVERRGRPRKKSYTRDPSYFEHMQQRYARSRSSNSNSTTTTTTTTTSLGSEGTVAPCISTFVTNMSAFNYTVYLPPTFQNFMLGYMDPTGDGHCGFRCISDALRGSDGHYAMMRSQLVNEMVKAEYGPLFGNNANEWQNEINRIHFQGSHGCGQQHWMATPWDLFGFANLYNWAIVCYSSGIFNGRREWHGSHTVLPTRAIPGVRAPYGILFLLHADNHYLRLKLTDNCPIPPIVPFWESLATENVRGWDHIYDARIRRWVQLFRN